MVSAVRDILLLELIWQLYYVHSYIGLYIKSEIHGYGFNDRHTVGMRNFMCVVIDTKGQMFVLLIVIWQIRCIHAQAKVKQEVLWTSVQLTYREKRVGEKITCRREGKLSFLNN